MVVVNIYELREIQWFHILCVIGRFISPQKSVNAGRISLRCAARGGEAPAGMDSVCQTPGFPGDAARKSQLSVRNTWQLAVPCVIHTRATFTAAKTVCQVSNCVL